MRQSVKILIEKPYTDADTGGKNKATNQIRKLSSGGFSLNSSPAMQCTKSTFKHMRLTTSPKLINRQRRLRWEENGSKDADERACEKARHILETYEPPKLSDAVLKKIRDIVDSAEAELGTTKQRPNLLGKIL